MRLTIKTKLLGLTAAGLVFVAGVSATGYWGITSLQKATVEVATTGAAIRNHVEAGMYKDMTRDDFSAIFAKKGQERQDSLDNLSTHAKVLAERVNAARDSVLNPDLRATLNEESKLVRGVLERRRRSVPGNHARSGFGGGAGRALPPTVQRAR